MMDPLPPDPYAALNVSKDATAAEIKTAYRKLALKCHPDKAKDKGEEFHKIQQAYELVGDDASRRKYEDSLRIAQLKQDINQRRGSGPGPNVDIRTAAFDVRTGHGSAFQARGPPRYEERKPPTAGSAGVPPLYSNPRSPYAEEENGDNYFSQRSSSRKYDGMDGTPKRGTPTKSKPPPRSEEVRETLRKQKVDSTKSRNEKKKQRDQEVGRERRGKFASSFAQVESDDSESEPDPSQRRRSSTQNDFNRKENRRSEDEYYDDMHSQKYHAQSSNVKEYINRAKVEAVPVERNSPPPQYPRRSSAQDMPLHTRSSDEQVSPQDVRRSARESRPAMVRKSSSRPKEKTPEPVAAERKAATKESRPKANERRQPESHATSERRPPPLFTSASSPSAIKIPKSRSSDDYDTRGAPPPRLDRSSTMPANQQSPASSRTVPRKTDTTPAVSSNLRHAETNDSGYSTGTSPNEATQAQFPSSTKYQYGTDTVQVDTEYESVLREPNRSMRRSPSPIGRDFQPQRERPASGRDREKERGMAAPPPARSASFHTRGPTEPEPSPSSRRRPSLSRNSSSRDGSGRVPTVPSFQRGASMPIPSPIRTGMPDRPTLFGEVTGSPVDFRDPWLGASSPPPAAASGARRGIDAAKVNYSPRISSDDISYSYRSPPNQGGPSPGAKPERRGSEDISKQQHYRTYMAEANGRERRTARPGVAVG